MQWYHEVDADWLAARKNYITATDISKLVPEYKRSLKLSPDAIAPGFAALWAEKNSDTELDPKSYGPAARGHWMESFAVSDWNGYVDDGSFRPKGYMFHWDDCIISKGIVGFSPDAMDIEQVFFAPEMVAKDHEIRCTGWSDPQPTMVMEVKAYEPAHHMKCCIKDRMEQDELVQVATAFHVLDDLEEAVLCFYCPGAPISMKAFRYKRDDLKEQIELVGNIVERYRKTVTQCKELSVEMVATHTEKQVHNTMLKEVELDREENIFEF